LAAVGLLVGDLLADAAAVAPQALAATLDGRSVRYAELDGWASRCAANLARLGVCSGQRVAWWCGPDLRSLSGFAAAARTGALFVPLNPSFGAEEAARMADHVRPALVVADEERRDAAEALGVPVAGLGDLDEDSGGWSGAAPRDGDPHVVYLTSGTTGDPKGVVVSHRASWLRAFPGGSTFAAGLAGDGGILASFPLFHYGGWHYVLEAWHHRTAVHLCRRFDGPTMVETADRWRPVAMYCIPAVWRRVLEESPRGEGLESVRHADTGTSAAPMELLRQLRAAMPRAATSVLYGSSEGGHHSTLHHRDVESHPGSVGRVAPPGVIRLSEEGEILFRGPTLMDGYLDRSEDTAAALAGGWYHTGDLGVLDDDGYLYVTGRAKEVIRTGGESVAPAEVEQALADAPGVTDVAVVGVPDEAWGELVCAVVVPAPGCAAPDVAALRSHLNGRLAAYKHPRLVVCVDRLPRTAATGQVQRRLLRETVGTQRARTGG
jgi:fatty-acyl-CoA synthase